MSWADAAPANMTTAAAANALNLNCMRYLQLKLKSDRTLARSARRYRKRGVLRLGVSTTGRARALTASTLVSAIPAAGELLGDRAGDGLAKGRGQLLAGVADQGIGGASEDGSERLAQAHVEHQVELALQVGEHLAIQLRFVDRRRGRDGRGR